MFDFGKKLKDWLEGATAQIIPGDKKTFSTVMEQKRNSDNRSMVPLRMPEASSRNEPVRMGDPIRFNSNKVETKLKTISLPKSQQSFTNKIRDIFDANTEADQYRRKLEGREAIVENPGNLGTAIAGGTARLLNTAKAGADEIVDTTKLVAADVTNNTEAWSNANKRIKARQERQYRPDGGLLNAGTIFDSPEEMRSIGVEDLTKKVAGATLETAAEVVPFARGASMATKGVKANQAIPRLAAEGALYGGTGSTGSQLVETGEIDARQTAADSALGAALAAGGFVIGRGATNTARALRELPKHQRDMTLQAAAKSSPLQEADTSLLVSHEGAPDRAQINHYKQRIQAGEDVGPLFIMRENDGRFGIEDGKHRYQAYKELGAKRVSVKVVTPEDIRKINEGGYFSLPGRADEGADNAAIGNTTPNRGDLDQMPVSTSNRQDVSSVNSVARQVVEDAEANRNAIQSAELDRAIQEDLGRAGATTRRIVEAHAERTGQDLKQAANDVWRVAQQSGWDIRDGRPAKMSPDSTPLSSFKEGTDTRQQDIENLERATQELRDGAAKGFIGAKNSLVIKESPYQQVHMYVGQDGRMNTFVTQKRADGRWAEIKNSHAPIKSANDQRETFKLMGDPDIQSEVARASQDGNTRQYIWTEDTGGTSVGLATKGRKDPVTPKTLGFDPDKHMVEGGFVRDKNTGEVVGNYVAVGPNGVQVQVGRQFITLDIEPSKLQDGAGGVARFGRSEGGNNNFNQPERWVEAVTDDERTREQLRNIVIYPAREAEANLKVEANALGEGIKSWRKSFKEALPLDDRKAAMRDAVYVLEPDEDQVRQLGRVKAKEEAAAAFTDAHGPQAMQVLGEYEKWMRAVYDNMLERMNTVRRHNGMDEIPRREDYITHSQEIAGDISQLYQNMREGIFGDIDGAPTRGKLPAQIAGRTENFKPIQKYNPYGAKREGDAKPLDPFSPLATYAGVSLHNIHLTKPAALVRSLETALRAAQEFANDKPKGLKGKASEQYDKLAKRFGGNYSDSIEWLTEHANILSGKSSSLNRWMLKSAGGRKALRALNFLQRASGRANILGNQSSVIAQSLNFPSTLGTNGAKATVRGVTRALAGGKANAAWRKSNFMKERYTDGSVLRNKTALEKVLRPFGVPLGVMEKAFVHVAWNSSYEKAIAKGLKGDAAIRAADSATSKIVAGRSIGDTAHVYQSTLTNAPLQFTREVTEQWKNFTKDQSVYGKALMLVAAFGMNHVIEEVTGRSPLPDPIDATIETVRDFAGLNDEEDQSLPAKVGRTAQRAAETVGSAVPLVSSVANLGMTQGLKEGIFGEDSDLGRYEGSLAAIGPVDRLGRAIKDLIEGNYESAGQNAVAALPVGAQIRKTWQGLDTLADGEATNATGKHQTDVEADGPLDWIQGALYGKNALSEVQDYFSSGSRPQRGGGPLADLLREREELEEDLQERLKGAFSDEDYEITNLSADDREYLIKNGYLTQQKVDDLERYELDVRRDIGMDPGAPGQNVPELPENTPFGEQISEFYKNRSYVYDEDLDSWRKQEAEGAGLDLWEWANSMRSEGGLDLPRTNEVAELYAEFSAKRAEEGWGETKENTEKGKFLKKAYMAGLADSQRELLGMSGSDQMAAIDDGEVTSEELDQLIAFDDALRSMGLYGEIPNTVRKEYGYSQWSKGKKKTSSGRKGGGRRSSFTIPSGLSGNASTRLSALRKLISNAGDL